MQIWGRSRWRPCIYSVEDIWTQVFWCKEVSVTVHWRAVTSIVPTLHCIALHWWDKYSIYIVLGTWGDLNNRIMGEWIGHFCQMVFRLARTAAEYIDLRQWRTQNGDFQDDWPLECDSCRHLHHRQLALSTVIIKEVGDFQSLKGPLMLNLLDNPLLSWTTQCRLRWGQWIANAGLVEFLNCGKYSTIIERIKRFNFYVFRCESSINIRHIQQ